jgi:hypothetical protein
MMASVMFNAVRIRWKHALNSLIPILLTAQVSSMVRRSPFCLFKQTETSLKKFRIYNLIVYPPGGYI